MRRARRRWSVEALRLRQEDNGGRLVDGTGPKSDDRNGEER